MHRNVSCVFREGVVKKNTCNLLPLLNAVVQTIFRILYYWTAFSLFQGIWAIHCTIVGNINFSFFFWIYRSPLLLLCEGSDKCHLFPLCFKIFLCLCRLPTTLTLVFIAVVFLLNLNLLSKMEIGFVLFLAVLLNALVCYIWEVQPQLM